MLLPHGLTCSREPSTAGPRRGGSTGRLSRIGLSYRVAVLRLLTLRNQVKLRALI